MRTERVKVSGMRCGGCAAAVARALEAVAGVDSVDVDLESGMATVRFNEAAGGGPEGFAGAIQRAGFGVSAGETDGGRRSPACCG